MVFRRSRSWHDCNWKLVVDAFLEACHIPVLHRCTIQPFFAGCQAASDQLGRHFRSAAARNTIGELFGQPHAQPDLREHMTVTHNVFPNSIFIFHPDYISHILLTPHGPGRTLWRHAILIPADQRTPALAAHWERSFELIERGVFQGEGLYARRAYSRVWPTALTPIYDLGDTSIRSARFIAW